MEAEPAAHATKTAAAARTHSTDPTSIHGRFLPGAQLGERYRIVGLLGRGGMGEVYRADDLELGQSVALKFVPEKLAAHMTAWHRLRGEVRTARQLAHPNICRVYDIANADGHFFFSMEYVDGDDLSHVLRRLGPPSKDKAVEIARQLCAGLAAAHETGILHRDLKPANVMLDGRGRVRIADFGLAGLAEELEADPQRAGTPAYMAPEQQESGKVSRRSDIYSLGLVLYELFTGKRPFDNATTGATTSAPSMQSHSESIDPAVDRIVQRCLESDPAERPASVYEVMAALPGGDPLAAALEAGETPSPEMVADAEARGGLSRRRALLLFGLTLLSLGLLAGVGQRWTRMPEKSPQELGDIARDIVNELGHEFATHQASLLFANQSLDETVTDGGSPWPPAYYYWHRASRSSLQPLFLHNPISRPGDPASRPPGTVDVVLGASGRLVDLDVVPELHDPTDRPSTVATDWSPILTRAGLDPDEVESVPPVREVPAYCDEVATFRVARPGDRAEGWVFQVAAHRGRIVQAFSIWEDDPGRSFLDTARKFEPVVVGGERKGGILGGWIFPVTFLLPAFLAWHNIRQGRADSHGAVVFGVVVFGGYFSYDLLHTPTAWGLGTALQWGLNLNPAGHSSLHGLQSALTYVAIEPYVRRVWPKALIGWARLARGRWRDPLVGREVLLGTAVALTVFFGGVVVRATVRALTGMPTVEPLPNADRMRDSATMLAELPHMLAVSMALTMILYFFLLALRWITRRDWIALLVTAVVFHPAFAFIAGLPPGSNPLAIEVTMIPWLAGLVTILVLAMRIGLIAMIVATLVFLLGPSIPMTLDVSSFYAPSGLVGMLAFAALAAFGLRYSLGAKLSDLLD